ncbi:FecR family protein [Sphingobacterium paludis]|uniref:FecR family protein n=1 Tax=Sphingobacterium paludis TaxID=1476465 RepID=A0A4R7CTX1_9SPHI|nr:FecR family protein [Sphingobacterium paludis]TDS11873.1 FecR family protein [Sphingobacterium paludis]
MQDETSTFIHLLKKQIDGSISDDELLLLNTLLAVIPESEQHILFNRLLDEHMDEIASTDRYFSRAEEDEIFQRIVEREVADPETQSLWQRWRPYRWLAAAACLLLLSYATITLWDRGAGDAEKPVLANSRGIRADVKPAAERAILTTEDGRSIALDSIKAGQDVLGSNFKLVRLSSGELQYQSLSQVGTDATHVINTPKGGIVHFVLPDGSRVWLNAASSLTFNLGMEKADRMVTVSGEAYFEVAKRKTQKFIVKSTFGEIEVLGTKFNVNTYVRRESKIALLEGSIRLKTSKTAVRMKPSQLAAVRANGTTEMVLRKDIEDVLLWKNGLFHFQNADAYQVAEELSRWYNVDVAVSGMHSHHQINGKISRDLELSKMLDMLKYLGLEGKYKDNKLIIHVKMKPPM